MKKEENQISSKEQIEGLKALSNELARHSPLIRDLTKSSRLHDRRMFGIEVGFGIIIVVAIGLLTIFGKIGGETLAGLIGVIIGYIGARKL